MVNYLSDTKNVAFENEEDDKNNFCMNIII